MHVEILPLQKDEGEEEIRGLKKAGGIFELRMGIKGTIQLANDEEESLFGVTMGFGTSHGLRGQAAESSRFVRVEGQYDAP